MTRVTSMGLSFGRSGKFKSDVIQTVYLEIAERKTRIGVAPVIELANSETVRASDQQLRKRCSLTKK